MQNINVGNIIRKLRTERGMTQKQLADKMNISDKTISKWERGLGCPDVSLLSELSDLLDILCRICNRRSCSDYQAISRMGYAT